MYLMIIIVLDFNKAFSWTRAVENILSEEYKQTEQQAELRQDRSQSDEMPRRH